MTHSGASLPPTSAYVKSLAAAQRRKQKLALAEGERVAMAALQGSWRVHALLVAASFYDLDSSRRILSEAKRRSIEIVTLSSAAFDKVSDCETSPPVAAVVSLPEIDLASMEPWPAKVVVLDRIGDPGNAGALVRSAAAFGFCALLTTGSVSPLNEKFIRSSAGTCFLRNGVFAAGDSIPLSASLRKKGYEIAALSPRAEMALRDQYRNVPSHIALVLGNETTGVDDQVWAGAIPLKIPMLGAVESLNVGITGSIAMYELSAAVHP